MTLTGNILSIEGGKIVVEFPDWPKEQPPVDPATPLAYRASKAAAVLGMSRSTLWRERGLGRIKQGPKGLYTLAEIQRYLKAQTKCGAK